MSNGDLLLTIDENLSIRDMYYPYIGMENHVGGHSCRLGVSINNTFLWIDSSWKRDIRYKKESLVTEVLLTKPGFPVTILVNDCVHHIHPVFIRQVTLSSQSEQLMDIKVFFSFDFHIGDIDKANTAFWHPGLGVIIHYKRDRYFLVGGSSGDSVIPQYAVGITEFANFAGAYIDAEDGELSGNPVAHGSVDSVLGLHSTLAPGASVIMYAWICAGKSFEDVSALNKNVIAVGFSSLVSETRDYFSTWVNKNAFDFDRLPDQVIAQFKRSLLVLRSQIDNRGGVIASCDSDILRYNKDTYNYVWPRDGAFVSLALDAAGYHDITNRFFSFCRDALSEEGFFYQKYNPDGTWGSSWHPWIGPDKQPRFPIQEDETALVLFSLWRHYETTRDLEFILLMFEPLICKAADFLVRYRDPATGLILPSYDLWEEQYGIFTFTASAVYGGLLAASQFAGLFGDRKRETLYRKVADEVKEATLLHLYDEKEGRFLKSLIPTGTGEFTRDYTVDISVFGIYMFGLLPADDQRMKGSMAVVESTLWVKTAIGGYARYQGDLFMRVGDDFSNVPGNPWPICTLWLAGWHIAQKEPQKSLDLLLLVTKQASSAGLLAEQLDPYNGIPLSVSPLTWSHSTYVGMVIRYLNLVRTGEINDDAGLPVLRGIP